jgi:hypothetical protein
MRLIVTNLMALAGLTLMAVSYFRLAAPWCATSVSCSDPTLPWAASLVVLGILIAISASIFYAVYKDSE